MKKYAAELIGTFALVFCGTGAIVINEQSGGAVTHLGIALTFGAIVLAMIYTFGNLSGAHFNPAVTLGFWLAKTFSGKEVAPYIISQLGGALLASATLKLLFPSNVTLGASMPAGSDVQSFILELLLTYFLMLVIIHVSQGARETGVMAGIAIGTTVMLEALFAGPISGASMNPARSIAPALLSGELKSLWVYIAAPISGAALATFTWKWLKA